MNYNIVTEKLGNGNTIHYKKLDNETCYHKETEDSLIELLERLRSNHIRLRFHWGNTKTGEDWGDDFNVCGTIGRSSGRIKIPILIHNIRSMGGGAILDHCIVKITESKGKAVLYQHANYHIGESC